MAMSGILSHIPELMAVSMPTVDSYERVGVGRISAGGLLGWGFNNRDMPLRQVTKNHWELRTVDGCANPYAVVAGMIMASIDRKPLTIGNPGSKCLCWPPFLGCMLTHLLPEFTPMLSDEEREKIGLTEFLPRSLEESLEAFQKNKSWMEIALGKKYAEYFV